MTQHEEILQDYLADLEAGVPLQQLLTELPETHTRLRPLLAIADLLRHAPEPIVDLGTLRLGEQKVRAAFRAQAVRTPFSQNGHGRRRAGWQERLSSLPFPQLRLAGALATVCVLFIALGLFTFAKLGARPAAAAELAAVDGRVEVGTGDTWRSVADGDHLQAGQRIRTASGATATLIFFEGSRVHLAAETELTLVALQQKGESLQVELEQRAGRTAHRVVPLQGEDAAYLVRTSSGTASVHGTTFSVRVDDGGQVRFSVDEGQVAVSASGEEVMVQSGQTTLTQAGAPPSQPATQAEEPLPSLSFTPDELLAITCDSGASVSGSLVNTASAPKDEAAGVQLGYTIVKGSEYVDGVSLDPAGWPSIAPGASVSFGINVALNDAWRNAPDGIEAKVRVFVAAEDHRPEHHVTRLTLTVRRQCGATPTPTVTITPTTTVTPTGEVTPTATVTATTAITPTGSVECTGATPHPQAQALAAEHGVLDKAIMAWFCAGNGFGEIDLAYDLAAATDTSVDDIFTMRASGLGWGQIKQELGVKPGGGPPEDHPGNGNPGAGPPADNPGNGNPGGGPPADNPGNGPPEDHPGNGHPGGDPPADNPGNGNPGGGKPPKEKNK